MELLNEMKLSDRLFRDFIKTKAIPELLEYKNNKYFNKRFPENPIDVLHV